MYGLCGVRCAEAERESLQSGCVGGVGVGVGDEDIGEVGRRAVHYWFFVFFILLGMSVLDRIRAPMPVHGGMKI